MDVVLRDAELLEVPPNRRPGDAGLAQGLHGRAGGTLRELLAVLAEDQAVVDELRRLGAERGEQPTVQVLVRPVVEAAHDVRDPEVDVVDDARQVVRRGAVLAQQRDPVEAGAELFAGLAVPRLPLALPDRPFVPLDTEPAQVVDELFLTAWNVARCIGVVDPKQHPVAYLPVCDSAQRVPDVQRTGRARGKTHALHRPSSLVSSRPGSATVLEDA